MFVSAQPIWHSIKSSDPNVTAAGSLLIKIGFLPASSTGSFSKPVLLDPVQRNSIIVALKNSEDETEGSRRASREESVLLNSPVRFLSLPSAIIFVSIDDHH